MKNNNILTPVEAIQYLVNKGECGKKGKNYTVVFKNGCFCIKETGTLTGNLNNLYIKN